MQSLVEKNVDSMLNKLFGNKDETLKLITKLNLISDMNNPYVLNVLNNIKQNNEIDLEYIKKDMKMTIDNNGNIIPIDDIDVEPENTFCDKSRFENYTIIPSNR